MTKTRPIIGIVPSFDNGHVITPGGASIERVYLRRDYLSAITSVGATPLILSAEMPLESILELCDGVIISGGQDIDPAYYNEQAIPELRDTEPGDRFDWEKTLIDFCDVHHIPILGICYGMQRLNVHYGGSLIQDIPREIGHKVLHDNTTHAVRFTQNFLGVRKGNEWQVASRHHQALGRLAPNIAVCAEAADGIVEAAMFDNRHFGMQWHPESDETGAHVYRIFVERCMVNVKEVL